MSNAFDKARWEEHWQGHAGGAPASMAGNPVNPYLVAETSHLAPGTALDAGCGAGNEAVWLASTGWQVTAADISRNALTVATARAEAHGVSDRITWLEVDLSIWTPPTGFDLVASHYAHPAIPQLTFYARISEWVNPGGTLLLVGHLPTPATGADQHPPAEASATLADIAMVLDPASWRIITARTNTRVIARPDGHERSLHDVIVRAERYA